MPSPESKEIEYRNILSVSMAPNTDMGVINQCLKDGSNFPVQINSKFNLYYSNRHHDQIALDTGTEESEILYDGYVSFVNGKAVLTSGYHHKNKENPKLVEAAENILTGEFNKLLK